MPPPWMTARPGSSGSPSWPVGSRSPWGWASSLWYWVQVRHWWKCTERYKESAWSKGEKICCQNCTKYFIRAPQLSDCMFFVKMFSFLTNIPQTSQSAPPHHTLRFPVSYPRYSLLLRFTVISVSFFFLKSFEVFLFLTLHMVKLPFTCPNTRKVTSLHSGQPTKQRYSGVLLAWKSFI